MVLRATPIPRWIRGRLGVVGLLTLAIQLVWPASAPLAAAKYAIRYYGTLQMIGSLPAPQGTAITVISDQSATSPTVCGTTTVNDQFGHYTVDIQPIPDTCVQRTTSQGPSPNHIFLVNGENIHVNTPISQPRLDMASSMAQTERVDLQTAAPPSGCSANSQQSVSAMALCDQILIAGDVVTDVLTLRTLISNCEATSKSFAMLHKNINASHPVRINVGRGLPDVLIDDYKNKRVDLNQLEQFPNPPLVSGKLVFPATPMTPDWAVTRCEALYHLLYERYVGGEYISAHNSAIDHQKQVREDFGQAYVVTAPVQVGGNRDQYGICRDRFGNPIDVCVVFEEYQISSGKAIVHKIDFSAILGAAGVWHMGPLDYH
jgi:hypothetical protein